ncbi:MAG TPA: Type 1 glutamine amidotransferase-like domain-containing protein [bacterium]|nr:Type 1 glutamine amidotransferase-like domain-containing protein [bacterium]
MKLLLTSAGRYNKNVFDFFLSILPYSIDKCSMLLIYYKPDGGISDYIKEDIDFFQKLKCDLTVFNMYEENFIEFDKKFDIIWICGGNTFHILNKIKKTGIFDFIKKSVLENNSIYFGISAGSIIAGPEIKIAGEAVGDYDENTINLKNLDGFNFTNICVFPHFEKYMKHDIDIFKKKVDYPVLEITDNEAIFIEDNKFIIIK